MGGGTLGLLGVDAVGDSSTRCAIGRCSPKHDLPMAVGYRHNRDRQPLLYIFSQHHRCLYWQHRRNPAGPRGGSLNTRRRGSYSWQAAVVVGGVSALRRGNPICRYRWSKGLTFNPFTLARAVDYCGRQNDPRHDNGT